jgi:hypothetical protein
MNLKSSNLWNLQASSSSNSKNSSSAHCNTPGVCHQLSNGFKLNHDMLSGVGDVKVKPMEISPNLNSDIAPLLYI